MAFMRGGVRGECGCRARNGQTVPLAFSPDHPSIEGLRIRDRVRLPGNTSVAGDVYGHECFEALIKRPLKWELHYDPLPRCRRPSVGFNHGIRP